MFLHPCERMWIERWIREEHLKPRQHPKPTTLKSCIISTCTCSFKNVHLVNIKALQRLWVPTQFSIKIFVSISISRGGENFLFLFLFPPLLYGNYFVGFTWLPHVCQISQLFKLRCSYLGVREVFGWNQLKSKCSQAQQVSCWYSCMRAWSLYYPV